ncbi:MAG: DUF411 domain-containing protein [Vicinamibacterales bacterium]
MQRELSRRMMLAEVAALAGAVLVTPRDAFAQTKVPIVVYKSPDCLCCHQWVQYLTANGFAPTVTDTRDMDAIKVRYKVPKSLVSCHTALVANYVIEGHIPAADVKSLLVRKPAGVIGLTIPGMPQSAPGMDAKPFEPYTVLAFDSKGTTTVYAKHEKA